MGAPFAYNLQTIRLVGVIISKLRMLPIVMALIFKMQRYKYSFKWTQSYGKYFYTIQGSVSYMGREQGRYGALCCPIVIRLLCVCCPIKN